MNNNNQACHASCRRIESIIDDVHFPFRTSSLLFWVLHSSEGWIVSSPALPCTEIGPVGVFQVEPMPAVKAPNWSELAYVV